MAVTYVYAGQYGNITFDFTNSEINCDSDIDTLECQELVDAAREAEYSETGAAFSHILNASGKEVLDPVAGVTVGITCVLLGDWLIYSEKTSGSFRVIGGNCVQVSGGDIFKPNPLVTEILILSAASTIVTVSSGSGLSGAEHAKLMAIPTDTATTEDVTQAVASIPSEERVIALMFDRHNTVSGGRITEYVAGGNVTVDVAYDSNGVPLSEDIRE